LLHPREVTLFLAVDTAAVLLPVKPQFFADLDSLLPTGTEVSIVEFYAVLLGKALTKFRYHLMILISAVEESGRESIESKTRCFSSSYLQSGSITVEAAFFRVNCNRAEKFLQPVFITIYYFQFNQARILLDRCHSLSVFQIRMDVVVEEKPGYLNPA